MENVNRWRGQVGLPALDPDKIIKQATIAKGKGGTLQWFKIDGAQNKSILVSILQRPSDAVFVKMTGPSDTVQANKKDFLAFAASVY